MKKIRFYRKTRTQRAADISRSIASRGNFFEDPLAHHASFFQPAENTIHRKCESCKEEEKKVQKKETANSTAAATPISGYVNSLNGKGQSLPKQGQQFFSSRMGYDFSNVKIHTGNEASQSADAINAQAYTYNNHIVFNENKFQPETADGKKLLAHELAHISQNQKKVQKKEKPFLAKEGITADQIIKNDSDDMRSDLIKVLSNTQSKLYKYISSKISRFADKKKTPLDIDDPVVFGKKYRTYFIKKGGKPDPSSDPAKEAATIGGFYDPDTNSINLSNASTYCHALHETLHSFSQPDFIRDTVGAELMEGLTQYFTDIILDEQLGTICKSHQYKSQLGCAKRVVTAMGFENAARFFFVSDLNPIASLAKSLGYQHPDKVKKLFGLCERLI